MARQKRESASLGDDALWYKDAVIYELHVRAFFDSDGDGIGDFWGLIEKLDYLQDLGVTAVWLLPFYPSPLKDDGYDISDYIGIQPAYGHMHDFKVFVDEAHRRGIRVITELVINHTSDQHPWFQRSRRSPGTRWRRYYVWSDTPEKYREARIIFQDWEQSNWTFDPVAKQYYWHRFYSHQPDLNYDSASVRRALFRVMDYWLRLGVDGMRVDAVPYLYERDGTNCENLPETHAFLKELRRHIDEKFQSRMLLAEANQWPEDAAAYFGEGDEFHMAFQFPLMPRIFMAVRREDRFPIIDIIQQTPPIPDICQWALFLRNHDELTLEMVTDEERDYMYRMYAQDPTMRLNLGIRRRLAPLLNNDRKKIELMHSLLFSLPGTPVIYYGDEIGMGDNFHLGDRDGVRTPMQWSPDRNAGFSHANPQKLYLPPIIDPEYHYEAINVENQQNNPDSLFWWMKRSVALRKSFRAFSRGSLTFLYPENRKVLAFIRRHDDETILVVSNLSHAAQSVALNLDEFRGKVPVELFGRTEFAPIGDNRYYLTIGPYGFYWLSLEPERIGLLRQRALPAEAPVWMPTIPSSDSDLFDKKNRETLGEVLAVYIGMRRWFRGKARDVHSVEILDVVHMRFADSNAYLVLVGLHYSEGESETYVLPLAIAAADESKKLLSDYPQAGIARLRREGQDGQTEKVLYDAMVDKKFCSGLLEAIARRRHFKGEYGEVSASPTRAFKAARGPLQVPLQPRPVEAEQTNTSAVYGDRLIVKLFRRVEAELNPELEVSSFLTQKARFAHTPPLAGAVDYRRKGEKPASLAVLQGWVPNQGDAWQYTLDHLGRYFKRVLAHPTVQMPPLPYRSIALLGNEMPALAEETIGPYLSSVQLLGERTAELHQALASAKDDPDFAPEELSITHLNSVYQSMRSLAVQNLDLLRQRSEVLPEEAEEDAQAVLAMQGDIIARYHLIRGRMFSGARIRCHGDYHLGQVLYTGKDFFIIDFEGEAARPLSERRLKRCPLRDVAGMIRSFNYAAYTALAHQLPLAVGPQDIPLLEQWGRFWSTWVSAAYLSSYLATIEPAHLLPADPNELKPLLDAYLLDKAVYEIGYELNNRPDWVRVPLRGILHLMETE